VVNGLLGQGLELYHEMTPGTALETPYIVETFTDETLAIVRARITRLHLR